MIEKNPVKWVFRNVYLVPITGVLVILVVWLGVLVGLSVEKTQVLQAAQEKANLLAEALGQHTETTIRDVDIIAMVVKREFQLSPTSINLKELQESGFFSRATTALVSIADAKGQVLQSTMPYVGSVSIADREHFLVHRKPEVSELYISRPILGRVSGKWTVQLTRRLNSKTGDFAGVVVISEDCRYLIRDFSSAADLGNNGSAAVFLADGTMLSDNQQRNSKTDVADGDENYRKINQDTMVFARRSVSGYPLMVEVALSRSEIMAPYIKMKSVYLTGTALFSIFFVLFLIAIYTLIQSLSKNRNYLRVLSETDTLTGLWNRYGILACLERILSEKTGCKRLSVIYIDLGNLKQVNDTLGHEAGDQLLKKIATRLKNGLVSATFGRFGGDEFVALLDIKDAGDDVYSAANRAVHKIVDIFNTPVALRGSVFNVRASIGIAVHAQPGGSAATLIREADEAMYFAKSQMRRMQKTVWQYYSEDMRDGARRTIEVEQELRLALSKGTLKLTRYPVRYSFNEKTWGLYVCVAIPDDLNMLKPIAGAASFTRENGLLRLVTEFVLSQMYAISTDPKELAKNLVYQLSKDQFLTIDCASILHSLIMQEKMERGSLVFEVPESAFLEEPLIAEQRASVLLEMGVKLIVGGFSGGFSSFLLLEKGIFRGVMLGQCKFPVSILTNVVEQVTRQGVMVILGHDVSSVGFEDNPLVCQVDKINFQSGDESGNDMNLPNILKINS